MTTKQAQSFTCPQCGRRFHWKAEFAGRTVKCRCGASFAAVVDASALPEPVPTVDDPPARAPVATAAPAGPRVMSETVLRNLPYPLHGRRAVHEMATEDDESSPWRDLYVPLALLVVGIGVRLGQVMFFASQQSLSRPAGVGLLACEIVIGAIALLGGAAAAAGMLSTTFGDVRLAVLKVLGIAVATSAAAYFVASLDREPWGVRGMVMAWHLVLLFYFVLFTWLFKLDLQEGLMTTVIVMAIQLLLLFAISRVLSEDAARALLYG